MYRSKQRKRFGTDTGSAMENIDGTGAHLTPTELRTWTSLLDAARILDSELEAELIADHQMTHREYEILVRVDGHGGHAAMSVLARQIEASGALVTQTVSRLEERGWILRQPSDTDRRIVHATLTDHGRIALRAAAAQHAATVKRLLLEPFGDDLRLTSIALGRVADHLRDHRANDACSDPTCVLPTEQ